MLTSKNLTLLQHISAIVVDNIAVTLSRIFFSPEAFCDTEKVLNRRLQPGIRPRTRLRSSRRCSRLPSGLGKGHPSPLPPLLDAFRISVSALLAPHFSELLRNCFFFCIPPWFSKLFHPVEAWKWKRYAAVRRLRPKFISGSDRSSSAMTSAAASQLLCSTDRRSNWHRCSVHSSTAVSDDEYRQMLADGRHTFSISL